jgi:hypothetical protein
MFQPFLKRPQRTPNSIYRHRGAQYKTYMRPVSTCDLYADRPCALSVVCRLCSIKYGFDDGNDEPSSAYRIAAAGTKDQRNSHEERRSVIGHPRRRQRGGMLRRCHWVRGYLCRADSRSLATLKVCSSALAAERQRTYDDGAKTR